MEAVFFISVVFAFTGAVIWSGRQLRARGSEWRHVAEEVGLRVLALPGLLNRTMKAVSRTARVEFTLQLAEEDRSVTRIEIRPREWAHGGFAVSVPNLRWADTGSNVATEISTGDPGFDTAVVLSGEAAPALAAMNQTARAELVSICRGASLNLGGGSVTALVDDKEMPGETKRFLEQLLRFTERIAAPFDVANELARNAREDRIPGVREQNLLALARGFPDLPVTRQVLRDACGDPSPAVRLAAGRELREEGVELLLTLIDLEKAPDGVSASAVSAIGRRFPPERYEPLLRWSLRRRRIATAKALAELSGRARVAATAPILARIVDVETGELAVAAAKSLGQLGDARFENALIGGLRKGSLPLALEATVALMRVGSPAAVMPLREFAERRSGEVGVRRAVDRAVAAIRARTPGASPGQLSLAAAPAGQLSLVPAASGQLSLSGDEAGRLSEPPAGG